MIVSYILFLSYKEIIADHVYFFLSSKENVDDHVLFMLCF